MTLVLGRVGVDIALRDKSAWSRTGGRVTISGFASGGASVADGVTLSEQLLGLADNPDEPFIACTWSSEPWFDGYYAVVGVSVPSLPGALAQGWFPYTIELERVADGASPRIDCALVGDNLSSAHAVAANAFHLAPNAANNTASYYVKEGAFSTGGAGTAGQVPNATARTTETGALYGGRVASATAATNAYASFECAPADYYDGHCLIRSGSTLRRVVGRRMKNLPTNWEIGNGLIRITPGSAGRLITECYSGSGSTYESSKTWHICTSGAVGSNINDAWTDVSIVRNSPEAAALRLSSYSSSAGLMFNVDIILRRGHYFAYVYLNIPYLGTSTPGSNLGWARASAEAATALTGGLRATSNDADGNRYVFGLNVAQTADTTQGALTATAATNPILAVIGYEFAGSGAASINTAANVLGDAYFPLAERMSPRVR